MMERDELIGRNVARLRGDLSQKELADRMRRRDLRWSQATVWSIEKGERPLRLSEASHLAEVLDVSIDDLLASEGRLRLDTALREVSYAFSNVRASASAYVHAQRFLAELADQFEVEGIDKETTESWLSTGALLAFNYGLEDGLRDINDEGIKSGAFYKKWLEASNGEHQEEA